MLNNDSKRDAIRAAAAVTLGAAMLILFALTMRNAAGTHWSPDGMTKIPGGFSDLYPRWHALREMYFNHRDPYSDEIAIENQRAFYGKFDTEDGRRRDPAGFAYPLTVSIPLLPFLITGYRVSMALMAAFSIAAIAICFMKWSEWAAPNVAIEYRALVVALLMIQETTINLVILRQPGIFALVGVTGAIWALRKERQIAAGLFLALAAVKPQMAIFPVLVIHAIATTDWKNFRKTLAAFWATSIAATLVTLIYLPDWPARWLEYMMRYQSEAIVFSTIEVWTKNHFINSVITAALAVTLLAILCLAIRKKIADTSSILALSVLLPVLVMKAGMLYNHVFAIPAALMLFGYGMKTNRVRTLLMAAAICGLLFWMIGIIPEVMRDVPKLSSALGIAALAPKWSHWTWPWKLKFLAPIVIYCALAGALIYAAMTRSDVVLKTDPLEV